MDDELLMWFTTVYAFNTLDLRKTLWQDIENMQPRIRDPWFLMCNFNNVLRVQDRIGGSMVHEAEYRDLVSMMERAYLYDKDRTGYHFTWFNNQVEGPIYSKIDRVISNMKWHQKNVETIHKVMDCGVSDHALLRLVDQNHKRPSKNHFKFQNVVITTEGFIEEVRSN